MNEMQIRKSGRARQRSVLLSNEYYVTTVKTEPDPDEISNDDKIESQNKERLQCPFSTFDFKIKKEQKEIHSSEIKNKKSLQSPIKANITASNANCFVEKKSSNLKQPMSLCSEVESKIYKKGDYDKYNDDIFKEPLSKKQKIDDDNESEKSDNVSMEDDEIDEDEEIIDSDNVEDKLIIVNTFTDTENFQENQEQVEETIQNGIMEKLSVQPSDIIYDNDNEVCVIETIVSHDTESSPIFYIDEGNIVLLENGIQNQDQSNNETSLIDDSSDAVQIEYQNDYNYITVKTNDFDSMHSLNCNPSDEKSVEQTEISQNEKVSFSTNKQTSNEKMLKLAALVGVVDPPSNNHEEISKLDNAVKTVENNTNEQESCKLSSDDGMPNLFGVSGLTLSDTALKLLHISNQSGDSFMNLILSSTRTKLKSLGAITMLLGTWNQLEKCKDIIEKIFKLDILKHFDDAQVDNLDFIEVDVLRIWKEIILNEIDVEEKTVLIKSQKLCLRATMEGKFILWELMENKQWKLITKAEALNLVGESNVQNGQKILEDPENNSKKVIHIDLRTDYSSLNDKSNEIVSNADNVSKEEDNVYDDSEGEDNHEDPAAVLEAAAQSAAEDARRDNSPPKPLPPDLDLQNSQIGNLRPGLVQDEEGRVYDEDGNILMGIVPGREEKEYKPKSQKMLIKPGRALCTLNPARADHQCEQCGFMSSWEGVRKHKRRHHPRVTYKCQICGKRYGIINDLRRHWANHKGQLNLTLEVMKQSMHCEMCGYDGTELELRDHISSEHSGKEILCTLCNQVFSTKADMEAHVTYEHIKKKSQNDQAAAAKAVREATTGLLYLSSGGQRGGGRKSSKVGGPKFKCIWCGSRFSQESSLRYHLKIRHIDVKQYSCQHCNKTYVDERILKTHIKRTHVQEKRHFCDICDKGFFERRQMEEHRKIHLNLGAPKRYLCTFCGCEFFKQAHLRSHEKIHKSGGEFQCNVCDRAYFHTNEVHQHKPPDGPYRCGLCNREYRYRRSLNFHLKKNHNVDPQDVTISVAVEEQSQAVETEDGTIISIPDGHEIVDIEYEVADVGNECDQDESKDENDVEMSTSNEVVYMCEICAMIFTDMSQLEIHFEEKHDGLSQIDETHMNHDEVELTIAESSDSEYVVSKDDDENIQKTDIILDKD